MKVNTREMWTRILLFFLLSVIIRLLSHTAVSLLLTGYTHVTLGVTFDLLEKDGGSEPSLEHPTLRFKGSGARAAGGSCRPIGSSGSFLTAVEDDATSDLYKT